MTEYVTRIKSGIKIYVRAWPTILTRSDVALRGKNHKKVKRRKKERNCYLFHFCCCVLLLDCFKYVSFCDFT